MTEIEEGRYLYCLVRTEAADPEFSADGIDDEPVSVVAADGIGAVVHRCDSLYDSDDPTTIQRWLLRHQSVVDEAGEAFGTPLPFQFDTVLRGDDEGVREWLRREAETLSPHLERLAGRWEYRIEVTHRENAPEEIAAEDEELTALREQIDDAPEGKQFLLKKQYETRLDRSVRARRERQADELADRLAPHVTALRDLGQRRSISLDIDTGEDDPLARFAALADDEQVDALGDELESIADAAGTEVRFTGPWPPYTFAPDIGGGDDGADEGF